MKLLHEMTAEEIQGLEAGDDLSALILVHVFGWRSQMYQGQQHPHWWNEKGECAGGSSWNLVKEKHPFSEQIHHAWRILEQMKHNGIPFRVADSHHELAVDGKQDYVCEMWPPNNRRPIFAYGTTGPLAICRTALLVCRMIPPVANHCPSPL